MIELVQIEKYYNQTLVVQVPAFVFDHQIYWIKGINGSGKTTLMKLIAGLLPFNGDVVIDREVSIRKNRTAYLRQVSYAEAEPQYPSFLTGLDLLAFYRKTKGGSEEQSENLMDRLRVRHYIGNPVGTYSSGMLKKISLLLAFTGHPKLILLDEPLVTIDDLTIPVINQLIREYHEQDGATFLLTSHQPFETEAFSQTHRLLMDQKTIWKL